MTTPSPPSQSLGALGRKLLPRPIFGVVRRAGTAILTPIAFARRSGHFRSSIRAKAVDRDGNPLPWYTYPCIDFLSCQTFEGRQILEFGAGQSTLWWSQRADAVTSFEADSKWHAHCLGLIGDNAAVHLVDHSANGVEEIIHGHHFDIVVVDGLDRFACAKIAADHLKPDGAILLDNSEGYWGPEGTYPIIEHLHDIGFKRIDFYGHAPGVILPHCSSLFFREGCFLLSGEAPPVRFATR